MHLVDISSKHKHVDVCCVNKWRTNVHSGNMHVSKTACINKALSTDAMAAVDSG